MGAKKLINLKYHELIKSLNILIKQYYHFVWSVEKNTEIANTKIVKTKKWKKQTMFLPKSAVCDSKKSKFIKEQEISGLLSSLGIKTPLSRTPLVGPFLF